jgi:hypothetical protein
MKKELKPIIIHQDLEKVAQFFTALEEAVPLLQSAWDAFRKTGFYDPKVELPFLMMNHENLKFQHTLKLIREKLATDSELQLKESEAAKIYTVSTPDLDAAIAQVKAHTSETGINNSYFSIKNDKVVVSDQAVAKYTDRYTVAAVTDREIQTVKKVDAFIRIATELQAHLKANGIDFILLHKLYPIPIQRLCVMDSDGKYKINYTLFGRWKKQLARMEPVEEKVN